MGEEEEEEKKGRGNSSARLPQSAPRNAAFPFQQCFKVVSVFTITENDWRRMALTVETSTPSPASTGCDQDLAVFDLGGLDRPHFQGWPNGSMARGIPSED